jgi:hypothetical protein
MPSPSKDFHRAYKVIEDKCELSLTALNKRYIISRKDNPLLTPEEFFAVPDNLKRTYKNITIFICNQGVLPLIDICRALTQFGLKIPVIRSHLNIYLEKHPEAVKFDSFEALWQLLQLQPSGISNPISVDGRYFHNLKYLADAYKVNIRVKNKTLTQIVADRKSNCGLNRNDTLELTKSEFAEVISRVDTRISFQNFKKVLAAYMSKNDLQIVGSDNPKKIDFLNQMTADEAYKLYKNNTTSFYFRCCVCAAKNPNVKPFIKSLDRWYQQGCPACGWKRAADKCRLPSGEVRRRVSVHQAGIDWFGEDDTYVNNMSPLTVICKDGGHKITRAAQDFFENGSFMVCPDCVCGRIGETIAVSVVNFLLDTGRPTREARELTPSHLLSWKGKRPLRHDGYFELHPGFSLKIAVEHMGAQHTDPDNKFHSMNKIEKEKNYSEMKKRDAWKQAACKGADGDVVFWVAIPDLYVNCKTLVEAAKLVATELIAQTNSTVLGISGFEDRTSKLDDSKFVRQLLIASGRFSPEVNLKKQLDDEKSPVYILDFDPIQSAFTLACHSHPEIKPWKARAGNAISSSVTERKGTRCRRCAVESRSAERRLTEVELDRQVEQFGFQKMFDYSLYKSNAQVYRWKCLKNPVHHHTDDTLAHLGRRCSDCRREVLMQKLQEREHAALKAIVTNNGDVLLSPPTQYRNNTTELQVLCARVGGCGKEYSIMPCKIKIGQMCSCDKHARGAKKRASIP